MGTPKKAVLPSGVTGGAQKLFQQPLLNELQLYLGLMIHHHGQVYSSAELLQSLIGVNQELEELHRTLKSTKIGTREEQLTLARIQKLEMERFHLLSVMNGQSVDDYAILPLHF